MPSASAPELPVAVLMGLIQAPKGVEGVEGRAQRGPQGGGRSPPPFPRLEVMKAAGTGSGSLDWFV